MATVVDALIVSLGLDPSGFIQKSEAARADMAKTADAGRRVASETEANFERSSEAGVKHSKELEAWGKRAAESLSLLRDSALGLLAVIGGADAVKMVIDTSQAEAATARVAHNLQLPDKVVSQWQMAMAAVGGSAEDANASLQGMQSMIMSAKNGDTTAANKMGVLHISPNDDPATAMMKASEFAVTHTPAIDQMVFAGTGITPAMFNFIDQGPQAVQATLDQVAPYAMTQKEGNDAEGLQKQWGILEDTFTGIKQNLEDELNPALSAFLTWLQKIADWAFKHPEITGGAVAAGTVLSGAAGAATLKKLAGWLLGRGGASAPEEAEEASAAAEVAAAGGSAVLTPALVAALGVYASNRLGEPGIDPNESAELRQYVPNAPKGTPAQVTADRTLPAPAQTLLDTIASGESGGDYSREYGSLPDMTSFSDHPDVETQLPDGTTTSAAGRYQFEVDTWRRLQKQLGLTDFSPKSQDQAAWQLAQDTYQGNSGRNLLDDLRLRDPKVDAAIQKSLEGQWPSLARLSGAAFAKALGVPLAPPAASPPAAHEAALPRGVVDLLNQLRPSPPALSAAQMAAAHHSAMVSAASSVRHSSTTNHGPVTTNNNHSAETHVHSVTVNTKATDADGIARSMKEALRRNPMLANMNTGLA